MTPLWPHQLSAIDRGRAAFAAGARRVVFVAPTASGKTRLAAEMLRLAFAKSRRPLWLARRRELVTQARDALVACGLRAGIIMAGEQPSIGDVQVASIDTLLARNYRPEADVIVADECHGTIADGAAQLVRDYPNAHVIGLTATPERADGRGLGEIFDRLIVVAQVRELVEAGYLVPCEIRAPAEQLKTRQIARRPIDAYREFADGSSALVFAGTVQKAREYSEDFENAHVISAFTELPDRERMLREFTDGNIPVLCNVGTLTEGTDLPIASTIILARKVDSAGLWIQIIGRGRRRFPGKTRCMVLDLHGSSYMHGHPDEPRIYSLEGIGIRRSEAAIDAFCRVCGCPIEPGAMCPDCGTGPRKAKPVKVTDDELIAFKLGEAMKKPIDERTRRLAAWIAEGKSKGWKPGAPRFRFKAAYGYFPKKLTMLRAEQEAKP